MIYGMRRLSVYHHVSFWSLSPDCKDRGVRLRRGILSAELHWLYLQWQPF